MTTPDDATTNKYDQRIGFIKMLDEIKYKIEVDCEISNELRLILSDILLRYEIMNSDKKIEYINSLNGVGENYTDDMKYYTMGYYIYNFMLTKPQI